MKSTPVMFMRATLTEGPIQVGPLAQDSELLVERRPALQRFPVEAHRRQQGPSDRLEHGVDELRALTERLALHDEDQLGVARRAVVVDAELARVDAAPAQGHALGVPERDDSVDL